MNRVQNIVPGPGSGKTPRETLYRLGGPFWVNGMRVWRIFDIHRNVKLGEDHFTFDSAKKALEDVARGKTQFFFDGIPFRRSDG